MANVEKLVVELDAKIDKYVKGMDKANKSTDKVQKSVKKFDLSIIAASVSAGLLTRSLVGMSDIYVSMQNKLRGVTKSTEELNDVTKKLFDIARDSRSDLESTVTLYSRMARATKDLDLTQKELLDVTSDLNKAFKLNGSSADEAASAVTQLSQAMSSGKLAGDEFKSTAENAPIVLDAIAFATGKARGELKQFAADGKITSEVLIKSIQAYSNHINTEFAKTQSTFAESLTTSKTNIIELVGALGVSAPIKDFGSAIVTLTENLDIFAAAAGSALMIAAIANIKALTVVLRANPLIAGATALTAVSLAIHSIADAGLDAELAKLTGARTVSDDIDVLTRSIQDLRFEAAELTTGEGSMDQAIMGLFVSDETLNANKQRLAEIETQITAEIALLEKRKNQLATVGDVQTSAAFSSGKATGEGKSLGGTVELGGGTSKAEQKEIELLERARERIQEGIKSIHEGKRSEMEILNQKFDEQSELIENSIVAEEEKLLAMSELRAAFDESVRDAGLTDQEAKQEAFDNEIKAHSDMLNKKLINEKQFQKLNIQTVKRFTEGKREEAKSVAITERQKTQVARQGFSAAMALNSAFLEDNKAVNAGLIVADTAVAMMGAMKDMPYPYNFVAAASVAAMGAVQLANNASSGKGGGSISSGGGGGGIGSIGSGLDVGGDSGQDDILGGATATTISSFAESGESGSATVQIDFNADSGGKSDQLLVETLNELHAKGLLDIRQG